MNVMMASNDNSFCPSLSHAYARRGAKVFAGIPNLFLKQGDFDLIHFHWPEELLGFGSRAGDPEKTGPILELIDWWRERVPLVATVHNLVPHVTHRTDGPEARYYADFYARMDVIGHFSDYSKERYAEVYPSLDPRRQVVHGLNDFDHLRPLSQGKAKARALLGLPEDKRIFAVIGSLRAYQELVLIEQAWRAAAGPDDLLLIATPLPWTDQLTPGTRVKRLLHRVRLAGRPVRHMARQLSEATLVQVVEGADAILLARSGRHLNSGLLPLSLTFGTPLVAPDYGIYRETIATDANALYEPRSVEALADAIRRQSAKDPAQAVAANLDYARTIGWDHILDRMRPSVDAARSRLLPTSRAGQNVAGL